MAWHSQEAMYKSRPAGSVVIALWLLVLLCCAQGQVPELTISKIEVVGNRSVTDPQVLAVVRSRTGAVFSSDIADEDTKRIARLPGVEYSYYSTAVVDNHIELTFVVVERNIVRAIIFTGNEKFKSGQLIKELDFKLGDYLDPVQAQAGVTALADFYRKKGFPYSQVTIDGDKLSEGRVVYRITEGTRVRIADIRFSGNQQLKSNDLMKVIKLRKKKFVVFSRYYVEDEVVKDVTNLQNVYYQRGYLDSRIEPKLDFNEDKTEVVLVFQIVEGAAYTVEQIRLAGVTHFDESQLRQKLKLQVGKVYNEKKADSDVKGLLGGYRQIGYVEAEVEKKKEFVGDDKVNVEYQIKSGSRFKIGRIDITGNRDTQDKVVRHVLDEYDFKPGHWYNADTARGDGEGYLEKLVRSMSVAQAATITPTGDDPNMRDARVNITEGQTGLIMLGAGVGSDSGLIGQLIFEQRNFDITDKPKNFWEMFTGKAYKGAGQTLRIALEPGTEVSRYSISFNEPYWREKPISMDLLASSFERERESYNEERIKGFLGFEKRYKSNWRRSIGFRGENVDIGSLDLDAPLEVRDDKGTNSLYGLRFGFGKDMRNDRFNPTAGFHFDGGYEQVAGDFTFGIVDATYRYYKTIHEDLAENKTVLAIKVLGATTVGNAPVFEKFYAGGNGAYGIRGFAYRGISPRGLPASLNSTPPPRYNFGLEKKDPIGSEWIALANAEVTIPLTSEVLSALFFVDSGMVEEGGYRAAVGTGIQVLMPQWFGPVPMRFEVAAPFMKDGDDETEVFSFSVGRLF